MKRSTIIAFILSLLLMINVSYAQDIGAGPKSNINDSLMVRDNETPGPKTDNETPGPKTDNETPGPKTDNETPGPKTDNETPGPKTFIYSWDYLFKMNKPFMCRKYMIF